VKERRSIHLDFEVDKITNSIENVLTKDVFATDVLPLSKEDLKNVTKKGGWVFDWKQEFKQPEKDIYKLTIVNNIHIIQGLISLETKSDHIFMHLVESAPFNKGKPKVYEGVPGNLVAFACRQSFRYGYDGNVSFLSKTQLIGHYMQSLGAIHIGGHRMIIETQAALKLINKYFKN
jgi:hypothetical protein